MVFAMNSVARGSAIKTLAFIENHLQGIRFEKHGRTVIVDYNDRSILLPPYPEVRSVVLERKDGLIVPLVNKDFVVQWKANGSNTRIAVIGDVPLVFTRGGFLIDWNVYYAIINSSFVQRVINLFRDKEELVLFGELVGRKSLVRVCTKQWDEILKSDLEYLVFDIFDRKTGEFIPIRKVDEIAQEYGLKTPKTMWDWNVSELNNLLNQFASTCDGELWEGFVFKNPDRGSYQVIKERTLKWRLDETREFAEKIFSSKLDATSKRIFDSLRKFVFEGYLDPPITKQEVSEKAWDLRERILQELERTKDKNKLDKNIKKLLNELAKELLAHNLKNKAINNAIKTFRRIYVSAS